MTLYGYTLRYIPLLIMILINKMWSQVSLTPEYIDNISLFIPKTPSKIYKSQYSTRISYTTIPLFIRFINLLQLLYY